MSLARADDSVLVIVDIQEKLAPAMPPDVRREVLATTDVLLQAAAELEVPVIASEQYPKGLGHTLPEVSGHFPPETQVVAKDSFSCCGASGFSDALAATAREGYATFWSRSRSKLWRKGESSGHLQAVEELRLDCDNDAVLLRVRQTGPACHTGRRNCFFQRLEEGQWREVAPAPDCREIAE